LQSPSFIRPVRSASHSASFPALTTASHVVVSDAGTDAQQVASAAQPPPADPVPMLVPLPDPLDAAHAGNSDR
jgi:hypothetical protein